MNLKRRITTLSRDLDGNLPEMTTEERMRAELHANVLVGFHPDLVLVERQDCPPGEDGMLLYLYLREHTLWHLKRPREAEQVRARAHSLRGRAIAESRVLAGGDETDAVGTAIARALHRLGREPTPPPLGVLDEERLSGKQRDT